MKKCNTQVNRELATQALNYLKSLGLPYSELPDSDNHPFYAQNDADYQGLLALSQKGLGTSRDELQALVNAPLSETEVKRTVKRIIKIDELILKEYKRSEDVDNNPKYWDSDYFSGGYTELTYNGKRVKDGVKRRLAKLEKEQSGLFKTITLRQAMDNGYTADGMDPEDFKTPDVDDKGMLHWTKEEYHRLELETSDKVMHLAANKFYFDKFLESQANDNHDQTYGIRGANVYCKKGFPNTYIVVGHHSGEATEAVEWLEQKAIEKGLV